MNLLIEEYTGIPLEQEFNIGNISGLTSPTFAPWLYMHNSPTGTFTLHVYGADGFHLQRTFTSNDIKTQLASSDNYAHCFFRVSFAGEHFKRGTYTLTLDSGDNVYSSSSYLAWCRDFENDYGETAVAWYDAPLCFRIFNKENREI